ncbi:MULTISPECIES: hypothetical protein [Fusobacterium]|uniref:hypothetical protein n=1 Tax=Fusobacterium TaxID=848 RepID=UPI001476C285|nr:MULTISPECIES: hypothetical protein [Fusobacterium]NME35024.1 hypothetical protein [Fusobacterium sp. FSA-380-WT-3A]
MKKLAILLMLSMSLGVYSAEQKAPVNNVSIDKEVTGINRDTLELRDIKEEKLELEQEKVDATRLNVSTKELKEENEDTLLRENEKLKQEISQDVEKESSPLKYILGILAVIGIAVAL